MALVQYKRSVKMWKIRTKLSNTLLALTICFVIFSAIQSDFSSAQESKELTLIEISSIESEGYGGYLDWSSNGKYLAIATSSSFSLYEGGQLIHMDSDVRGFGDFSPDNRYFANLVGSTVYIRDTDTFDIVYETPDIETDYKTALSVAFNPSGTRLAFSYLDGTLVILNLTDMDNITVESTRKLEDGYNRLSWIGFISDVEIAAMAEADPLGVVTRINIDTDIDITTQALNRYIVGVTIDGEYLLTGEDSSISAFEIGENNLYNEIISVDLTGEVDFTRYPVFILDRQYIVVPGGSENNIIILASNTGEIIWNFEFEVGEGERGFLGAVAFNPVNNRLAASRNVATAEGTKTITTIWHVTD